VLYRPKRDSLSRTLALVLAVAILFLIANIYPFLEFKIGAQAPWFDLAILKNYCFTSTVKQ
jgi:uncharacterized paraquat-inducible protein A